MVDSQLGEDYFLILCDSVANKMPLMVYDVSLFPTNRIKDYLCLAWQNSVNSNNSWLHN